MKAIHSAESRLFEHTSDALLAVVQHSFVGLWLGMETEVFDKQTLRLVGVLLVEVLHLGFGQNKVQPEQVSQGQHLFELQQWKGFVDRLPPEVILVTEAELESIRFRSTSIGHRD